MKLVFKPLDALSAGAAAVPFAFALVRAVTTGRDVRYFWVALAALLGATVVIVAGRARASRPMAAVAPAAAVFVVATVLAVLAALLIGTTFGPGVVVVASAFGFCFAVAAALHVLARSV